MHLRIYPKIETILLISALKMNKVVPFFLILVANICAAQSQFVGDWKVTEVNGNSDFYYNIASDSIKVSNRIKSETNSKDLQLLLDMMKSEYQNKHYIFSEFELQDISDDVVLLTSKYHVKESEKVIEIVDGGALSKAFFTFITDDQLLLSFPIDENILKLTFKKIK